jgi:hypothetical protein
MSGFKSKRQMAQDRFNAEFNDDMTIVRSIITILLIILAVSLII